MTESIALKPCPFCGGRAFEPSATWVKTIRCSNCSAQGPLLEDRRTAWNRRSLPSPSGEAWAISAELRERAKGWEPLMGDEGMHSLLTRAADHIDTVTAERNRWHKAAMDAGVIVHADGSLSFPRQDATARAESAEARLKEVERERDAMKDAEAIVVGIRLGHTYVQADAARVLRKIEDARAHPSTSRTEGGGVEPGALCEGCPPPDYPTDETRCLPCPRRAPQAEGTKP